MTPLDIHVGICQLFLKIFATFLDSVIATPYMNEGVGQNKVIKYLLRCIATGACWVLVYSPSNEFLGILGLFSSETVDCYPLAPSSNVESGQ